MNSEPLGRACRTNRRSHKPFKVMKFVLCINPIPAERCAAIICRQGTSSNSRPVYYITLQYNLSSAVQSQLRQCCLLLV